jgi:hypothetical protein
MKEATTSANLVQTKSIVHSNPDDDPKLSPNSMKWKLLWGSSRRNKATSSEDTLEMKRHSMDFLIVDELENLNSLSKQSFHCKRRSRTWKSQFRIPPWR